MQEWREFAERIHDELRALRDELDAVRLLTSKLALVEPDEVEIRAAAALGFRHVFRHNYPGTLRWSQFKSLFLSLSDSLDLFRDEISTFLKRHG